MFSGIHILDSCLRAWGKGKHLELNAEHMFKLLIRNKKKHNALSFLRAVGI